MHIAVPALAVCLSIHTASAPVSGDDFTPVGTWVMTYEEVNGRGHTPDYGSRVAFDDHRFVVTWPDGRTERGSYQWDATASPWRIEFTWDDGPYGRTTTTGIYEIEGDTMRICIGRELPTELTTSVASSRKLCAYRRVPE